VLLASDGLWDVFGSSQEVVDFCHSVMEEEGALTEEEVRERTGSLAEVVVEKALRRGSMDNISAAITWFVETRQFCVR